RPASYPVRRCRGADHPSQAAPARRSSAHQRTPHLLRHRLGLSQPGRVRARPHLSAACFQLRLNCSPCGRTPITPLRRALTRDQTDTYAGNFATSGLALREPPTIGFKHAGTTAHNSGNRPPTSASTDPKQLTFEKSRLGDHDQAMVWLNKAYDARFNPSLLLRPAWDPLRSDVRFKDLLGRIGLPG